eukprot:501516_1
MHVLTLLDIVTDVVMLVLWYNEDRMIFFGISISILIVAQMSYVLLLNLIHNFDNILSPNIIYTLPFAPILPFMFYFLAEDSYLCKFIDDHIKCVHFDWAGSVEEVQNNWLEERSYKNWGYLFEGIFESFPQTILQIIAILYYNDT